MATNKDSQSIWNTVAVGVGFLAGGLVGVVCGLFFQYEFAVVVGYGLGAVVGSIVGFQIMSRRLKG